MITKEKLREKYEKETGKSHGNALFSTTDYACWLEKKIEALRTHDVIGRSEQLKAFVDEFIEAWEDGNGGDSDLYRKAKSL
jgi:hypothetical protein